MGESNVKRVERVLNELQKNLPKNDETLAKFEFQMLQAIQERQKSLRPETFKRAEGKETKSG